MHKVTLIMATILVTIMATISHTAPIITSTPITTVKVEELYIYNITTSDPDNHAVTVSVPVKPDKMVYSSGRLTWTPGPTEKGTYPITIIAHNTNGDSTIQNFEIIVTLENNTPPSITSTPILKAQVGNPYTYNITTYHANRKPVTVSLAIYPDSMTLTDNKIIWMPTDTGKYAVRVTAKDIYNDSSTQDFRITVSSAPINNAPIITSKSPINEIGALEQYTYNVVATDKEGDSIILNLQIKPEGMTLINEKITWIPTKDQQGLHTIKLVARDVKGDSTVQEFEIIVTLPVSINMRITTQKISHINKIPTFYLLNGSTTKINSYIGLKISEQKKLLSFK